jgi:hypothetical protein
VNTYINHLLVFFVMMGQRVQFIDAEIHRLETLLCAEVQQPRRLIISSGDISDVDGLYALAAYARTGADVLFVMNYPAYLQKEGGSDMEAAGLGLGYTYGTVAYCAASDEKIKSMASDDEFESYGNALRFYNGNFKVKRMAMMSALTDLAFNMTKAIWEGTKSDVGKGKFYFSVGGVNEINPFSAGALKNEIFVYRDTLLSDKCIRLFDRYLVEHDLVDVDGKNVTLIFRRLLTGTQTFESTLMVLWHFILRYGGLVLSHQYVDLL